MNLPNRLTLARLAVTPVFIALLGADFHGSQSGALAVFVLASATDWLDGYLARRGNLVTRFGALMDPLADKILTASAFVSLSALGDFPPWAATLIIGREFLITGLRTLAAQEGRVLSADRLGKHKTVWQIITILLLLAMRALAEWTDGAAARGVLDLASEFLVPACVGLTVVLTVGSGLAYLLANRALIRDA